MRRVQGAETGSCLFSWYLITKVLFCLWNIKDING